MPTREEAERYLAQRTGRLEYRFLRYSAVADELFAAGMGDDDLLFDIGAGMCDFDFYLRTVRGWKGRYAPVDASIDGTNLETWEPPCQLPYVTMIETLEHVHNWRDLLEAVRNQTLRCLVVTTPNTDEYGEEWVRRMDPTHVSPIRAFDLASRRGSRNFSVTVHSFFGQPDDSLLGVWT